MPQHPVSHSCTSGARWSVRVVLTRACGATWQEELATAAKYDGFQYVRFHGIFQDDMFIYREDRHGNPIYSFQYVDDLYDRMLSKGVRPFVELSFSPGPLSVHPTPPFGGEPMAALRPITRNGRTWSTHLCNTASTATASLKFASGTSRCGTSRTCINRSSAADRRRNISSYTK